MVVLAWLAFEVVTLVRHGGSSRDLGWVPDYEKLCVGQVDPQGPAAGWLEPGDKLLAVNGDSRRTAIGLALQLTLRPGSQYTVRIARGASSREVALQVGIKRDRQWLDVSLSLLPVAVTFLVTGVLVGVQRPEDRAARLYATWATLGAPGQFVNSFPLNMLQGAEFL